MRAFPQPDGWFGQTIDITGQCFKTTDGGCTVAKATKRTLPKKDIIITSTSCQACARTRKLHLPVSKIFTILAMGWMFGTKFGLRLLVECRSVFGLLSHHGTKLITDRKKGWGPHLRPNAIKIVIKRNESGFVSVCGCV